MAVEAQVLVERSRDNTIGKKRELLSVNEMMERKWPEAKIKAIVARGGGIPDEDAPEVESCMRFWVLTSTSQLEEDRFSQRASMSMQAEANGSFVDGLFASSMDGSGGQSSLPPCALNQLLASTAGQPAANPGGGHTDQISSIFKHVFSLYIHAVPYICAYLHTFIPILDYSSVYLSIYLPIYLYLSIYLSIYLYLSISFYLSLSIYLYLSIHI